MAIRTVRLDKESEKVLEQLRKTTKLSTSQLLKLGLRSLRDSSPRKTRKSAFEIYSELDLGSGGSAGQSTDVVKSVSNSKETE
jgi:hypothetical protein